MKDDTMAGFLKGTMCAVLGLACSVALAQNTDQQRDSKKSHDKEHKSTQNQDQGQRQTIRGTIAGVTAVGEAVIDPQTNTAIVAEVDYLTILGSPAGGGDAHADHGDKAQQDKNAADHGKTAAKDDSKGKMSQRQNVYLVALTPDTKVQLASGSGTATSDLDQKKSDQDQKDQNKNKTASDQSASDQSASDSASKQAFDKLEIGDKVRVEFVSTGRMHGKADKNLQASNSDKRGTTRTAGFRGDSQHKHGRQRIMMGEAKSITITSMPSSSDDDSTKNLDQNKDESKSRDTK
jgi:hypothetical protein